jgi:hypothetical protein
MPAFINVKLDNIGNQRYYNGYIAEVARIILNVRNSQMKQG